MGSSVGVPELAIIMMTVFVVALTVVPATRICGKAGFPTWLGCFAMVPIANVVAAFFLAFSRWPIEEQLAQARRSGQVPGTTLGG